MADMISQNLPQSQASNKNARSQSMRQHYNVRQVGVWGSVRVWYSKNSLFFFCRLNIPTPFRSYNTGYEYSFISAQRLKEQIGFQRAV